MSSAAKNRANRRNGAKSRGPTSAAGKARSARNRFLYTIDARPFVAAGEDASRFRELAKVVLEAFQPQTRFERLLVHRLCGQLWQRDRLLRVERAALGDMGAAASLPEPLRQGVAAGESLDRLAKCLELQIKLDNAIQQSIAQLVDLGRAPQRQAQPAHVEAAAEGDLRDDVAFGHHLSPSRPHVPSSTYEDDGAAEVSQSPPLKFSMAAPPTHFGKRRPSPRGR